MSDRPHPSAWSLQPTLAREVNRACDAFEAAWKAGECPRVEQYVSDSPQPQRGVLLRELVLLECACRRGAGETPTLAEYRCRFPELEDFGDDLDGGVSSCVRGAGLLTAAWKHGIVPGDDSDAWSRDAETIPAAADSPSSWPDVAGYEILSLIDMGAMGVVYKARQLSLQRIVALKMIRSGPNAGPTALSRFRKEAHAVASLNHPNIIKIFEFGEHNGLPYFAMELVAGGSVAARIAQRALPLEEVVTLMTVVARAVAYAHEQGLVHRDLKPANILYSAQGQPIVTDFGLVKRLDRVSASTLEGAILGTAWYMAPEQVRGSAQEISSRADIYALGAILYELLTGRPPHQGKTFLDTLLQVVTQEPLPPSTLQPQVPPELEAICLKCLQKDPGQRYQSALDLALDLERYKAGERLSIATTGVLEWREQVARRAGYEVLDLLGCGRTGFLYKARQVKLNRLVALKMLEIGTRPGPEDLARFRREAETLAQLHHPNIVQIFECDEQDGQPYFSVEYVDGMNLASKYGYTPQPVRQSAELVESLARTTHYAHQRGIIHCALKPGNVLLTVEGVPKITSFSHSLASGGITDESFLTRENEFFLASYRAPEQVEGRFPDIGPATDVYGLGTILYKLLTGRPPFLGETVAETREQVLTQTPVPPRQMRPVVPDELEAICLKCLRKAPADRYAGADVLAHKLAEFLKRKSGSDPTDFDQTETIFSVGGQATMPRRDASQPEAYIVLEVEGDNGRDKPLVFDPATDRRIILGRHPDCDVGIPHIGASRRHAMILYDRDQGWILQDLSSRSGTYLNRRRVEKAVVRVGDRIGIAAAVVVIRDLRPDHPSALPIDADAPTA